jgi:hypothetical protein
VKINPTVRAAFAKQIRWQPGRRSVGRKDLLFVVPVKTLDALWRKDTSGYLAPGAPGIKDRFAKLQRYLDESTGPVVLDAPEVVFQEWSGAVGFIDGRHRAALARDLGADHIMVAVPAEEADKFQAATKAKSVHGPVVLS